MGTKHKRVIQNIAANEREYIKTNEKEGRQNRKQDKGEETKSKEGIYR